jgi:hypothetical protein
MGYAQQHAGNVRQSSGIDFDGVVPFREDKYYQKRSTIRNGIHQISCFLHKLWLQVLLRLLMSIKIDRLGFHQQRIV